MMEQKKDIIVCEHAGKTFATATTYNEVIKDLNLSVKENEFVVLFGPGQCGKTTVLNVMAGLETLTEGTITVNGKVVKGPDPERGFVYQTMAIFPWFTVMQNVEYGPRMAGVKKKERRERAQHYIDLVGLTGFENSYPNQLSGGMQQRVGIARAYCNEPVVLFMPHLFDKYFICDDTFKNVVKDGETVGFQIGIKVSYYRGVILGIVNNVEITVDGETFTKDQMTFTVKDGTFTFDEMLGRDDVRWDFGEVAYLRVKKPGGLSCGEHTVKVFEEIRIVNGMEIPPVMFQAENEKKLTLTGEYILPEPIRRGV